MNTTQCSKRVYGGSFHGHACERPAKYEHEGVAFCGTHYPPNVEAREQKRKAEREAEEKRKHDLRDANSRKYRDMEFKASCFDELLSALKEAVDICKYMDSEADPTRPEDGDPIGHWKAAIAKAEGKS